jgi:hypothetical protein
MLACLNQKDLSWCYFGIGVSSSLSWSRCDTRRTRAALCKLRLRLRLSVSVSDSGKASTWILRCNTLLAGDQAQTAGLPSRVPPLVGRHHVLELADLCSIFAGLCMRMSVHIHLHACIHKQTKFLPRIIHTIHPYKKIHTYIHTYIHKSFLGMLKYACSCHGCCHGSMLHKAILFFQLNLITYVCMNHVSNFVCTYTHQAFVTSAYC